MLTTTSSTSSNAHVPIEVEDTVFFRHGNGTYHHISIVGEVTIKINIEQIYLFDECLYFPVYYALQGEPYNQGWDWMGWITEFEGGTMEQAMQFGLKELKEFCEAR
jgi:hypothetical protein